MCFNGIDTINVKWEGRTTTRDKVEERKGMGQTSGYIFNVKVYDFGLDLPTVSMLMLMVMSMSRH